MRKYLKLYTYSLVILLGSFSAHPAMAQVGKVGLKDSVKINPALLKQEDIPALEGKIREDLRSSDQYSDWDNLDRQITSSTEQEGNTQLNQYNKKRMMDEAAKASELIQNMTEQGSVVLRQNLDTVDVYGFQYFRKNNGIMFNSATDVKAPKNYTIGSGDQLQIVIWGYSDYNELFIVDKEGFIQPKYVGKINVKGLTLESAEQFIKKRISQTYNMTNSRVEVNLNYSRVITVNVVGEVESPGSYTMPAVNTAYNILAHIGGPTSKGSLRNIQIKRAGKVVGTFDLYKFLFAPESTGEIFLENNDYLYIPLATNIVTIDGAVARPGKYELLTDEGIADLLKFSGGFSPNAFTASVQVKRYVDNKMIIVDAAEKDFSGFKLQRGDVINIKSISQEPRNFVRIHGPVYMPGMFEVKENMRLLDVVEKAQGLMAEVYPEEAYILRVNDDFTRKVIKVNLGNAIKNPSSEDNALITGRDEIIIFSQNQFYDKFGVSISGAVRNPQSYPLLFGMSLRDLIMMSGGLSETALLEKAVIYRTLPTLEEQAVYVTLDTANNMVALDAVFLEAKDKVRIFSKTTYQDAHTVTVHGLVRSPGVMPFRRNMTLTEAILSAGGLQVTAAYSRIEVARIINYDSISTATQAKVNIAVLQITGDIASDGQANSFILQPYDEIFVREIPNFRYQQTVVIAGEVLYPGAYALTSKDEQLTSIIQRAGGLTTYAFSRGATMLRRHDPDKGLVIMNLEEAMRRKKSRYNYILRDGDSIFIPAALDFVTLKGALEHPDIKTYGAVNVPYEEGRSARYYINRYGTGFMDNADHKKTTVSHPNGEAHNTDYVFFGRKYPKVEKGSVIYVPEKNYLTKKQRKQNRGDGDKMDREKVLQTTMTSLTSAITMFLLIFTALK